MPSAARRTPFRPPRGSPRPRGKQANKEDLEGKRFCRRGAQRGGAMPELRRVNRTRCFLFTLLVAALRRTRRIEGVANGKKTKQASQSGRRHRGIVTLGLSNTGTTSNFCARARELGRERGGSRKKQSGRRRFATNNGTPASSLSFRMQRVGRGEAGKCQRGVLFIKRHSCRCTTSPFSSFFFGLFLFPSSRSGQIPP